MARDAQQSAYQHSRTHGAHFPFDAGLLTICRDWNMVDIEAGSRSTKVPTSSVGNRMAQRRSVGVGRTATDWPRKALGSRS